MDPRAKRDSIIGVHAECLIIDYYAQDGKVIAIPLDPYIMERARQQTTEFAELQMRERMLQQQKQELAKKAQENAEEEKVSDVV